MNELSMSDHFKDNDKDFSVSFTSDILSDDEGVKIISMASLSTLLLLERTSPQGNLVEQFSEEDESLKRLSLAYEKLKVMPKALIHELGSVIRILDISHNNFEKLDFLSEFKELTCLICDHNNISSDTFLPYMPKMELLWFNHCKIVKLYPWIRRVYQSCPNLRYLSLMGNLAAPSFLNGGSFYEYLQYRLYVIALFPKLIHLDGYEVTEEQRKEAYVVYQKPLTEKLFPHVDIPTYIRSVADKFSELVTLSSDNFNIPEKNRII